MVVPLKVEGKDVKDEDSGTTYVVGKGLGSGAFGQVNEATSSTGQKVAIKFEKKVSQAQLQFESKFYKLIDIPKETFPVVPRVYYFGSSSEFNINYLIMERLGPSLANKMKKMKKFSLKTTLQIAFQLIDIMAWVHFKGVIIRDIKPDNFLLGIPESKKRNLVHLIDLGLAKSFIVNNEHIKETTKGNVIMGTARYQSINTQIGITQSRRDDMESIGYIFIFFLKGQLPWQGKRDVVLEEKKSITIDELCTGCPKEFADYMKVVRDLEFDQQPPYKTLKNSFKKLFEKKNYEYDNVYDWDKTTEDDD